LDPGVPDFFSDQGKDRPGLRLGVCPKMKIGVGAATTTPQNQRLGFASIKRQAATCDGLKKRVRDLGFDTV
jgi:hypothetical protein